MAESFISYGKQCIDEDDIQAVVRTLKSDWITQGPRIEEFENAIAARVGAKYGVAFSSGTTALHAACVVAGIKEGDEVITSPITFAASANGPIYCGADVKLADIQLDTYCMDPEEIERAITAKTKAIIPVDFAGQPCDMDEIQAIAKKHNLVIIHDAAHSLGAVYKNRPIGSVADMTMFSFHPVKGMTTGEGGMIVTDDKRASEQLKRVRMHGIVQKTGWEYDVVELGYNYRITDIQCALGLSQLKKLDGFIEKRNAIARQYTDAFQDYDQIIPPYVKEDRTSAWHLYVLRLNSAKIKKTRKEIFDELRLMQIGVHVHYIPLHHHSFYKEKFDYSSNDYPNAEEYYETALTVPLYPTLTEKDLERVIGSVLKAVGESSSIGV